MRARLIAFVLLTGSAGAGALGLSGPGPAHATTGWPVSMRDCTFRPDFRAIEIGDTVSWSYDEGDCSPANHRVRSFGSPPESVDSGECSGPFSAETTCLNDAPLKQRSYAKTFTKAGTYNYYCPIHATISGGQCTGTMCGQIRVVAEPTNPPPRTTPPPSSPTPTIRRTTPPPTPTGTPTGTPTATPTGTPTGTGSTLAAGPDDGSGSGGAGGIWALAVAGIAVLGGTGYLVWRNFIAAQE